MSTDSGWRQHEPVLAMRKPEDGEAERERQVIACTCGGWRTAPLSWNYYGFSAHLEEVDAPSYAVEYWRHWASLVELPQGELDRDAVARELFDYRRLTVGGGLAESTGNGKRLTLASPVTSSAEQTARQLWAHDLCDRAQSHLDVGGSATAQNMIDLAESWEPGAWAKYQEERNARKELEENQKNNVTRLSDHAMMSEAPNSDIPA